MLKEGLGRGDPLQEFSTEIISLLSKYLCRRKRCRSMNERETRNEKLNKPRECATILNTHQRRSSGFEAMQTLIIHICNKGAVGGMASVVGQWLEVVFSRVLCSFVKLRGK